MNRFSKCYFLFALIASKIEGRDLGGHHKSIERSLLIMIVKEKMKKEFGIKSLKGLKNKTLKEFEKFLEAKI